MTPHLHLPHGAALLLVAFSSVWAACGKTSSPSGTDSAAGGDDGTAGSGNPSGSSGGSGSVSGTSFGGGPVSTGDAITTNSATTGFASTSTGGVGGSGASSGSSTTNSVGGSGGDSSCAPAEHLLEGCYSIGEDGAGQAGAAGAAGAGGIDPCWGEDAPYDCEASFEGQVLQVGRGIDARWCDNTLFGGLTELSVNGRQWLVIGAGEATLAVVLGRPSGALDVEVGDTVRAELERHDFYFGFMWGSRLTLTKNGEFLAVLNAGFPVEAPTQYGDLTLSWGGKLCERPYDGACTYRAHELDVVLDDEGLSVAPYSSAQLGPYEILTQGIFSVVDGGFCDSGDESEYLIARVKP